MDPLDRLNRREFWRFAINRDVVVVPPTGRAEPGRPELAGRIVDVSLGGAAIETPETPLGNEHYVRFGIEGGAQLLPCRLIGETPCIGGVRLHMAWDRLNPDEEELLAGILELARAER